MRKWCQKGPCILFEAIYRENKQWCAMKCQWWLRNCHISYFSPRLTWRWAWSRKACLGFQLCSTTLCMLMRSDWHTNQFYTEALGSTTLLAKSPWWNLLGSQTWQEMPHWWTAWGEIKNEDLVLKSFRWDNEKCIAGNWIEFCRNYHEINKAVSLRKRQSANAAMRHVTTGWHTISSDYLPWLI